MYKIDVYTDGACDHNPGGNGGWAFIALVNDERVGDNSGYEPSTTNQRMELTAAIKGLEFAVPLLRANLDKNANLVLHSDSAYLINCVKDKWWRNWQNNGWKTSIKTEVQNQGLWRQLIPYFQEPNIYWDKVAGHRGNIWNEAVDAMAVAARRQQK